MDVREAADLLEVRFRTAEDALKSATNLERDLLSDLVQAIEGAVKIMHGQLLTYAWYCLHACCVRFDRFMTPTPARLMAPPGMRTQFDQALRAYSLLNPHRNDSSIFLVHGQRWALYDLLDRRSIGAEDVAPSLTAIDRTLHGVPTPTDPRKAKDIDREIAICRALIGSFTDGTIRTTLSLRLPIVPVLQRTIVHTSWEGIETAVTFGITKGPPPGELASPTDDQNMFPLAASQWEDGYANVLIEFRALVDGTTGVTPLLHTHIQSPSSDWWPAAYGHAFDVVDRVLWKLAEDDPDTLPGKWIVGPSDLGQLRWSLWAEDREVDFAVLGPPGPIMVVPKSGEERELRLDISHDTPWSSRCRLIARRYLSAGETNECLFWLNVGVESLFESRCRTICRRAGIEPDELTGSRSYWMRAEEVVTEQFPELSGEIQWPDPTGGGPPSWFVRLKYLAKKTDLGAPLGEILGEYSRIQRHRTALFHGVREERVGADDAKRAFDAYEWLEQNLVGEKPALDAEEDLGCHRG